MKYRMICFFVVGVFSGVGFMESAMGSGTWQQSTAHRMQSITVPNINGTPYLLPNGSLQFNHTPSFDDSEMSELTINSNYSFTNFSRLQLTFILAGAPRNQSFVDKAKLLAQNFNPKRFTSAGKLVILDNLGSIPLPQLAPTLTFTITLDFDPTRSTSRYSQGALVCQLILEISQKFALPNKLTKSLFEQLQLRHITSPEDYEKYENLNRKKRRRGNLNRNSAQIPNVPTYPMNVAIQRVPRPVSPLDLGSPAFNRAQSLPVLQPSDQSDPSLVLLPDPPHLERSHLASEPGYPVAGSRMLMASQHELSGTHNVLRRLDEEEFLGEDPSTLFANFIDYLNSGESNPTFAQSLPSEASRRLPHLDGSLAPLAPPFSQSSENELRFLNLLDRFEDLRQDFRYSWFLNTYSAYPMTSYQARLYSELVAGDAILNSLRALPDRSVTQEEAAIYEQIFRLLVSDLNVVSLFYGG